jgi:hypothetical protein
MAKENRGWGYDRIAGALAELGSDISDQTVGNIFKRRAIPENKNCKSLFAPAPRPYACAMGTPARGDGDGSSGSEPQRRAARRNQAQRGLDMRRRMREPEVSGFSWCDGFGDGGF